MDKKRYLLTTDIGNFTFLPQGRDAGYVDASGSHVFKEFPELRGVAYRGITWHFSFHVEIREGAWALHGNGYTYFSRRDSFKNEVSHSTRDAIIARVLKAVSEFERAHPEAFLAAERGRLAEAIENANQRAAERLKDAANAKTEAEAYFAEANRLQDELTSLS